MKQVRDNAVEKNSTTINPSSEPVYTIGIAAKQVNLSVHSLRLYEKEGLILSHKTKTGRRIYSDLELEKIRCIRTMINEEGLNFEGIRRLVALAPCWILRDCNPNNIKECRAYRDRIRPCWDSEQKCHHPLPSCRDCDVYKKLVKCEDVYKYIYPEE